MTASRQSQRGQVLLLLILLLFPIVLMIAYVFNTGAQVAAKIQLQNAADAAVVSQATLTARSLNVMSANNVAITQLMAVNAVVVAYTPAVYDMAGYLIQELKREVPLMISNCGGGGPFNPWCYYYSARVAFLVRTGHLAWDYEQLARHQTKIRQHMAAYAAMNARMATRFAEYSGQLQADLSALNSADSTTRFYMTNWAPANDRERNYVGTGLPVVRVYRTDFGVGQREASLAGAVRRPVWTTGNRGTSTRVYDEPFAGNFFSHGYRKGRGPFPYARDDARNGDLARAFSMAKLSSFWRVVFFASRPWRPWDRDYDPPKYDRCWEQAAYPKNGQLTVIAPWSCLRMAIGAPVAIYAYGPQQMSLDTSSGTVDLIALSRRSPGVPPMAPSYFAQQPEASFVAARGRVYNALAPDLYTQDWRATLVPVGGDPETLRAMRALSQGWEPARRVYSEMGANELRTLTPR